MSERDETRAAGEGMSEHPEGLADAIREAVKDMPCKTCHGTGLICCACGASLAACDCNGNECDDCPDCDTPTPLREDPR